MEIKMGAKETLIKSWDYAIAGAALQSKKKKYKHNLTVTSERIIWTSYNDISLNRKELPIKDVKYVDGNFAKSRSFWAKVKLIIGIPLCIILIGIPIVKSALTVLRGVEFNITFGTGIRYGYDMALGKTAGVVQKRSLLSRLTGRATKGFNVTVHKKDAVEILNEIGAIIVDTKQN